MKKKKLLIIDDSPTDADIIKEYLEDEADIYIASSGDEGIEKAKKVKPNIIVLDLIMPKKTGFETCAELRKIEGLEATIIISSLKNDIDDMTKAFRCGADDYMVKPPYPEVLILKIREYLNLEEKKDEQ